MNNGQTNEREAKPGGIVVSATVRNVALTVVAALGSLFLLRYAQDLFVPIVLSVLIAYALDPMVTAVGRMGVPRSLAAGLVVIGLVGGTAYGAYVLRYQGMQVLQSLPDAAGRVRRKIQEIRREPVDSTSAIGSLQQAAQEIERTAAEAASAEKAGKGVTRVQIDEPGFRANDFLWSSSMGILSLAAQATLILFLTFFLLASGDLFKRKIVRLVGSRLSEKQLTLDMLNEINTQIERFLLMQIFTSVVVAVFTALALWAFGVNQPVIWGIAAGVFNSVPYVGPMIVSSGLAVVGFLQFGSIAVALEISTVTIVITTLEGFLLTPWLMGRASRINGVAMFIGILFWSWVWGVVGMIVAVPIMMVIKTVCERLEQLQPIGELLDEK